MGHPHACRRNANASATAILLLLLLFLSVVAAVVLAVLLFLSVLYCSKTQHLKRSGTSVNVWVCGKAHVERRGRERAGERESGRERETERRGTKPEKSGTLISTHIKVWVFGLIRLQVCGEGNVCKRFISGVDDKRRRHVDKSVGEKTQITG